MAPVTCSYLAMEDGRVIYAQQSDLDPATTPEVGSNIFSGISSPTLVELYRLMFQRVLQRGQPINLEFRCDTAEAVRIGFIKIRAAHFHQMPCLEIETGILSSVSRPKVALLDPETARSGPAIHMCSWCKRLECFGEWVEVEEAVHRLDLSGGELPPLSHGMCPSCYETVQTKISS